MLVVSQGVCVETVEIQVNVVLIVNKVVSFALVVVDVLFELLQVSLGEVYVGQAGLVGVDICFFYFLLIFGIRDRNGGALVVDGHFEADH